jgi:hypothetical protein
MSLGPLNLGDADLKGFDAVEPGRYNAEIVKITQDTVKNLSGTGKLPAGTPMVKVQFRLTSNLEGVTEGIDNRRVWASYPIPPKDYDKKASSVMKGMIARLFIALGHTEEEVRDKGFAPEFDDYDGKEVQVTVGREPKKDMQGNIVEGEFNNPVKAVKPPGSAVTSSGLL